MDCDQCQRAICRDFGPEIVDALFGHNLALSVRSQIFAVDRVEVALVVFFLDVVRAVDRDHAGGDDALFDAELQTSLQHGLSTVDSGWNQVFFVGRLGEGGRHVDHVVAAWVSDHL